LTTIPASAGFFFAHKGLDLDFKDTPQMTSINADPAELARRIRVHLAPSIVQQIYGPSKELDVIALEPDLERMVAQALTSPHGAALDPGVADTLSRHAADSAKRQEDLGLPACLLVPDAIRAPMARLLKRAAPRLRVLAHSEIPETHSIRIGSVIGGIA
jgi:flagellar biosynthesis protein FlhA